MDCSHEKGFGHAAFRLELRILGRMGVSCPGGGKGKQGGVPGLRKPRCVSGDVAALVSRLADIDTENINASTVNQ